MEGLRNVMESGSHVEDGNEGGFFDLKGPFSVRNGRFVSERAVLYLKGLFYI
jgi:hypothetical protein